MTKWRYALLAAVTLLSACSQHVVLTQDFPVPVMRQIQAPVTLYIPPELRDYIHQEKPEKGVDWTIDFGDANVRLFESLFTGMFAPLDVVYERDKIAGDVTVIQPVMHDYQFSTPAMSRGEYFEVWIKYSLQIAYPKNTQILDWHFTAYGREEASGHSASTALQEASRRAMRDAAAAVVLGLMKQPKARAHFESQRVQP